MLTAICFLLIIALVASVVYILSLRNQRKDLTTSLFQSNYWKQYYEERLSESQQTNRQRFETIENQAEQIYALESELSNLKTQVL